MEFAGFAAAAAAVTFLLSAVALALFFGGAGRWWGPVNDVFVAVTSMLLIPVIFAVMEGAQDGTIAAVLGSVSWLAIAGAILMAAGQLLLVAGRISLEASFATGGVGVLPLLVWIAVTGVLAMGGVIGLPSHVGWLAIAVLTLSGVLALAHVTLPRFATWVLAAVLSVVAVAWLSALGAAL